MRSTLPIAAHHSSGRSDWCWQSARSDYIYKFIMAFALTPLIYVIHGMIERYLGHDLAKRLKDEAAAD
jgi:uncharacterized PurR-regulated membrane protein YhhQ (DUF165 family)